MSGAYYQCQKCKKKTKITDESITPSCCGKPMRKIQEDICLQPAHAEHARSTDADNACDDFRGGN